ncbi:hypothetical protein KORDIASMS9_00484 [Kordia sp. SMS9]|uniref:hypothetical protein n=1 Tax=Kordia sp. SMS9 TaxID=2282170 RepID=UPI000E0D337B|nr:hypothetical protein [Kordia sp. SMS9]AXG68291.1 hypothetical protein KORDIASMS9_00484 [Kordia sp. SMS9]
MKNKNRTSLKLSKKAISNLNPQKMATVQGKGILSIGQHCTQCYRCDIDRWSDGLFCHSNGAHCK